MSEDREFDFAQLAPDPRGPPCRRGHPSRRPARSPEPAFTGAGISEGHQPSSPAAIARAVAAAARRGPLGCARALGRPLAWLYARCSRLLHVHHTQGRCHLLQDYSRVTPPDASDRAGGCSAVPQHCRDGPGPWTRLRQAHPGQEAGHPSPRGRPVCCALGGAFRCQKASVETVDQPGLL